MTEIPLFIPQFGELLQGTNYEMAESERATHTNDFTTHPIEDPERSFLIDHNREAPTELSISLVVSSVPTAAGVRAGVDRINQLIDDLLAMRARQSVSVDAFVKVYTGLRVYDNMAIRSLEFIRDPETPTTVSVAIELYEFRFARSPRQSSAEYLMKANNGVRDEMAKPLVLAYDRPIVEANSVRRSPRVLSVLPSQQVVIRAALRKLGVPPIVTLGIDPTKIFRGL